ncbi:MAG: cation transporter [Bacteroidales bacterium]|nr:cation transporter [Bacteroidales bacterium]
MDEGKRESTIRRVTWVGALANLGLLIVKFVAGLVAHSSAMVADAAHSLSDFVTDIIVIVFVRISAKPQDSDHDYGHGKYETIATLFIGLALVAAAIGIIVSGAAKLAAWLHGETLTTPGALALWAALLSIVVKEALYRYTVARGKSVDSPALVANAWHHRSDALSSIGAAIGIGGAILLGERWAVLDPLASIVVGAMLLKVAWDLLRGCLGDLTDQSLSEAQEREIVEIFHSVPDVSDPHHLRTRRIGPRIAIEAHLRMDGDLSLREAHEHTRAIEQALRDHFGPQTIVTLHMEPRKQDETNQHQS